VGTKTKKRIRSLGNRTEEEVLAISCGLLADEGLTAVEIMERLEFDYGVIILREDAYAYVRKAATRGWIRFVPPHANRLMARVRGAYPWLQDAVVIKTARMEDVAYRGAEMLLELLQQRYSGKEVHIGFSGGMAIRTLARRFAELLREPISYLPSKIVFHALVAGFDASDPATDPNAFFNDFVSDPMMPFETSFVALHAPAMIEARLEKELQRLPSLKEAYDRASEIDIVVTSTSCWTDDHSMLRHCMALAGESVDDLERAGCRGDILWQPIGADEPSRLNSKIRAMTVMKLEQLSELVARNKQVLLVAGPCHKCHAPKTKVVKAILDQRARLITHLVTDSLCARTLA
jgi:DNA-binding transcriptional regulator LsrR (DeoR family)